jgi:glycosyltransferase involved in cell wall biosynthesis
MKVLFISRATLYSGYGGDTVQIINTAEQLRKLGVEVTIALCNENNIDYGSYDLVHYFNIIRPADILYHIDKSRLPFVVSPIYVEYKEQAKYYNHGIKNKVLALMGRHTLEYVKTIARAVINGEQIISKKYLVLGHKKSVQYILKRCWSVLPNSQSEYNRLEKEFSVKTRYAVIPNAIDTDLFNISEEDILKKEANTVLSVAKFEPRKNQLNLVKALSEHSYKLSLAGDVTPNHKDYYERCKQEAGPNVRFEGSLKQASLVHLYRQNKVHVLPSWFETTGLSTLEAAACGCNIVISKNGDTEEYFSDNAFYCDPAQPESIKAAVDMALRAPVNKQFMQEIKERYNWSVTAYKTFEVYKKVKKV